MYNVYVNSRLHPLLIEWRPRHRTRTWIASLGERWLLLTPGRLAHLGARLGLGDFRVDRLLRLVRRHSPVPEKFCRRLGVTESFHWSPADYPLDFCPRCGGVHYPHPEEKNEPCPECVEADRQRDRERLGGVQADRFADRKARLRVLYLDSMALNPDRLEPNPNYNRTREVARDWTAATNRILLGGTYRSVSQDLDCSVGVLYRKVQEWQWENN